MPPELPTIRLSPATLGALEEAAAAPLSYRVRCLLTPAHDRVVVVLGEMHLKLDGAHRLGARIMAGFRLRGVETFPRRAWLGRLLRLLIHAPRLALRALTLGWIKGSTITTALELRDGVTFKLESDRDIPLALHVASVYLSAFFVLLFAALLTSLLGLPSPPLLLGATLIELHFVLTVLPAYWLRSRRWHWCINPAVAILTTRNETMAQGTLRMLREHPAPAEAVVVMGRAHVAGYCRELIDRHGWVELDPRLLSRINRAP